MKTDHDADYYAGEIYRTFCEDDDDNSVLSKAWHNYQATKEEIEAGDLIDTLVRGAIQYGVDGLLIHLSNEEYHRERDSGKAKESLTKGIPVFRPEKESFKDCNWGGVQNRFFQGKPVVGKFSMSSPFAHKIVLEIWERYKISVSLTPLEWRDPGTTEDLHLTLITPQTPFSEEAANLIGLTEISVRRGTVELWYGEISKAIEMLEVNSETQVRPDLETLRGVHGFLVSAKNRIGKLIGL